MFKLKNICVCSFVIGISMCYYIPTCKVNLLECYKNISAIQKLQEYIKIDTRNAQNLDLSTEFWKKQADELGLEFAEHRPAGLPVCVLTWRGSDPYLQSIMLNSHADVVSVFESLWKYPPFEAHIDEKGDMYGRGTQDTKSLAIQYLEAIRKLIEDKVVLKRTFHITVMPDEETGGFNGIIPFLGTPEFKSLNIGFALDEGITSTNSNLYATYVDKRPWQMKFILRGDGGHSFVSPANTSINKLYKLLNMTLKFRDQQQIIQNSGSPLDFGAYTSVNVNIIKAGIATNIIPSYITAIVDMRLSTAASVNETQEMIDSWMEELGNDTTIEYIRKGEHSSATSLDDSNPYWKAMQHTVKDLGIELLPIVCPATSDMPELRRMGVPAVGFAPRRNTANLAHNNNEYIKIEDFLEGIHIYVAILKELGNLP